MNDQKHDAVGLLSALFHDARLAYPQLQIPLEKDEHRLLSGVECRGLPVLTVDLPALGKHFDMCLAKREYVQAGIPFSRYVSRKHRYPRLFSGLMKLIFDDSGRVIEDHDPLPVELIRQFLYCFKKLRVQGSDSVRAYTSRVEYPNQYKVIKEFYHDETTLPVPSIWWSRDDGPRPSELRSVSFDEPEPLPMFEPVRIVHGSPYGAPHQFSSDPDPAKAEEGSQRSSDDFRRYLATLQRVADRVSVSLGFFDPLRCRTRHGPGAVSDSYIQSKFEFRCWPQRLDGVFPFSDFGVPNAGLWVDRIRLEGRVGVSPYGQRVASKLICVPKTQSGPRLIASEPSANAFTQQGIREFLASSLSSSLLGKAVTINDQEPSRRKALIGSKTGSLATVDLSNASDRLSCWVVERLFRRNFSLLRALHATRTLEVVNDIDRKQPSRLTLKKFAPMGSAVTFPVQSIFYCVVAITAIMLEYGWRVSDKNIRRASRLCQVYGDDIILPTNCGRKLLDILELTWMRVNYRKTFTEGNFRESCGMDAYRGHNVTPVYIRSFVSMAKPSTISSVIDASNNFFQRGYWRAAQFLERTIPYRWRNAIPVGQYGEGIVGLSSFLGRDLSGLRTRWNPDLQKWEYRIARVKTRVKRTTPLGEHALHQWFVESPNTVWDPSNRGTTDYRSPLYGRREPLETWASGEVHGVAQTLGYAWTSLE